MERIALYPGSFDPITDGHLGVLNQALRIADRVIVAIGTHAGKKPVFSFDERAAQIAEVLEAEPAGGGERVRVVAFDGLVVEAARAHHASILIRGLRNTSDFDYEMQMAAMNGSMAPGIQTVFLPASHGTGHISGTLVRQIARMGGDVGSFVPRPIAAALKKRLA